MPATRRSIVLHGGCADIIPDFEHQNNVRHELNKVIRVASISVREGKRAEVIVVEIIAALGDCPIFHASRGAALSNDGVHEVRLPPDADFATPTNTETHIIACIA